jgi:hypothetical protein
MVWEEKVGVLWTSKFLLTERFLEDWVHVVIVLYSSIYLYVQ